MNHLTVKLDDEDKALLEFVAKRRKQTQSNLIRDWIRKAAEQERKRK